MSKQTEHGISWCDQTWNPIRGCSRVSQGCVNCYAERVAARFSGPGQPYEGLARMTSGGPRWTGKAELVEEHLLDPLRWTKPRRVFVNSMSDLFHESLADEAIDRMFAVMAIAPRHSYQILTKRPRRMRDYLISRSQSAQFWKQSAPPGYELEFQSPLDGSTLSLVPFPLPSVWLGVSVEDQATADERIPLLLQTPAAVRWVSAEPLIGPVKLPWEWVSSGKPLGGGPACDLSRPWEAPKPEAAIGWTVVGGESGPGARPMHPDWARSLRDQCRAAGVPFYMKQLDGKRKSLADFPDDLRVREFPGVKRNL